MLTLKNKTDCCGCGACAEICPKSCIKMQQDREGFYYPNLWAETCNDCGLCEKVCPIIQVDKEIPFEQSGYLVQHRNEKIRRESTSGGAFTAIAQEILKQNGYVFGAAYTDNFVVKHIAVDKESDLWRFRNSKYVQSQTWEAFFAAKKLLANDKYVCFSGTPCQIEGLKRYLRKYYEKLITVDVVCRAVPSPLVFEKYLQMQRANCGKDKIKNILFRDKHYGYKYSNMTIKKEDKTCVYARGVESDPMLRAFFSNICDRPSCYDCKFKKRYRVSDFTIWDCFSVYDFNKEMDDDKGTTRVIIHSDKGRKLFEKIKTNINFHAVDPDDLVFNVKEMFHSVKKSDKREAFMNDVSNLSGKELFQKWFPDSITVKVKRFCRLALIKAGIYQITKRVIKTVLRE